MSERREPTLDQIALQWLCLWQMGAQLLAFTPAAFAREMFAPRPATTRKNRP